MSTGSIPQTMNVHSSVEWPETWRVAPLWSLFERIKDVGHPNEEMLSVYRDFGVVRKSSRGDNFNKTAENRDIYQLIDDGWLVVNRMKAWQGSVGISSHRGIISGHYICFRPTHDEDSGFLDWLLRSDVYAAEYLRLSRGVRPNQIEIDNDGLRVLPVRLPPLEEQRRIADFLDAETARIDALAAYRYQQSELLGERFESLAKSLTGRTAIRSHTLPAGWSTQQLRRTITSIKTGTTPSSDDTEIWVEHTQTDTVPWYGPSSIGALLGLTPSLKRLPRSAIAERVVPKFPSGSVLVIGIGATAGKVAYLDHEGTGNQQITALVPDVDMVGRFLAWQLWAATDELRELAPYTTLPIINNDFLKSFPIAVPPAAHQQIAVKRLDMAASRLRALERTAQQATSLLAERRQALITAAVTGQFDVSTASGRNVTDGVTA
ncbi:restriction endonuclease subunit S [Streptomyces sp. AK08-02]|uniref:restriction endonuclease subunit S n=1 Tax=Streptomyces sp. AK08-02 TaxID=3028654 RepID=UPI0029AF63C7|nr:restriction endonuclease subunit S [Streptomyces sp. AK08-02]MDX3750605.1 restriction endonuclease subunit S [Streptomyces sp. AK08-02]